METNICTMYTYERIYKCQCQGNFSYDYTIMMMKEAKIIPSLRFIYAMLGARSLEARRVPSERFSKGVRRRRSSRRARSAGGVVARGS